MQESSIVISATHYIVENLQLLIQRKSAPRRRKSPEKTRKTVQLPRTSLDDIVRRKSLALMQAQFFEATGALNEASSQYQQVARDEEWIGNELRRNGSHIDAAINLLSAASCWHKCGNYLRGLRLLNEVLSISGISESLRDD